MVDIPFYNMQGWILVSVCCVCLKGQLNGSSRRMKIEATQGSSCIHFIWELVRNAKTLGPRPGIPESEPLRYRTQKSAF